MSALSIVIMAAGVGSRFGGPKQIESVGPHGEWIVDYSVFDALRAGFERVLFVTRPELEPFLRDHFGGILRGRCEVDYVEQRTDDLPAGCTGPVDRVRPWGTGHAVLACRDRLGGPFAAINADDFYGRHGYALLAEFLRETESDHVLIGYPLSHTMTDHGVVSRGICRISENGFLESIVERKRVARRDGVIAAAGDDGIWTPIPRDAVASMNMWGFADGILEVLERRFRAFLASDPGTDDEFFLPSVIGDLVDAGQARVRVLRSPDPWYGMTYREDVERTRAGIKQLIEADQYPARLWGSR